jgi:DNA repair exonuclease SbcCD ATPase subunit
LETVALQLPGDIIRTMLRSLITSILLLRGLSLGATELPRLINEYRADERSLEAAWNLPWSELQQDRLQHHVASWQQRLQTVAFAQLERDDQVDWLLLGNHLRKELESLRQQRAQLAEMKDLLPFRNVIQQLVADQLERRAANPSQAAEQLAGLLKPLEELKKQLTDQKSADAKKADPNVTDKLPKITPVLALRAAAATNAIRDSLSEWFKFHDSFQPGQIDGGTGRPREISAGGNRRAKGQARRSAGG